MFKPTEYQIKSVATGNVCDDSLHDRGPAALPLF